MGSGDFFGLSERKSGHSEKPLDFAFQMLYIWRDTKFKDPTKKKPCAIRHRAFSMLYLCMDYFTHDPFTIGKEYEYGKYIGREEDLDSPLKGAFLFESERNIAHRKDSRKHPIYPTAVETIEWLLMMDARGGEPLPKWPKD